MKRFFIESFFLLAVALAARFIATAGDPAVAMFLLAMYAAILIGLSQERQFKRDEEAAALRRRLADMTARKRRLSEALVEAACEALWVSHIVETAASASYVIETPQSGRLVITLPREDADNADTAPAMHEEG